MKRFKTISLIFIWAFVSCNQTPNLTTKDKIKSIKTYSLLFDINGVDTVLTFNGQKSKIEEYDYLGNIVVESKIDSTGNKESEHTYEYDSNGKLKEIYHYYSDTLHNIQIFKRTDSTIYEYWTRKKNGTRFYHVIKYIDAEANTLKTKTAGKDSIYGTIWIHEYDSIRQIQTETAYQNDILWQETIKTYDDFENLKEHKNYFFKNGKKRLTQNSFYKYDEEGLIREDSSSFEIKKYFYNDNQDLIVIKQIDPSGNVNNTKFEYEYDKNDNWTKRSRIRNGKLVVVEKREIEYFE